MIYAATGFAAASLLLFNLIRPPAPVQKFNRFVIYEPAAHRVELTGSFTGWQRTAMKPVGNSGYWELNLKVPFGEHRFAYILDGARQMADPTLPVREKDDFGGENSILNVEARV
ncbi:MAG: glycogen-binding domain-containing protein [Desulfobacterales bacterium]|nr:glycogen-binding domain-containing protein [Desulfobacterales bacterium]